MFEFVWYLILYWCLLKSVNHALNFLLANIWQLFSCEASLSSCNLTDWQVDSQLAIFNFAATYRPLMKKIVLQNVSHFYQGIQNWFSKQEMELSKQEMELFKQEMELFHPLPDIWSKNLFYKMSHIFTKEFKIDFQNRKCNYPNRKWNYLNRKWNYFTYFQASD